MLANKRLFLKTTLGILFECVYMLDKSRVAEQILPLVNEILGEAQTEDKYIYNLFALIFNIVQKCGLV